MSAFWSFCPHTQTSEPDENGEAICAACGQRAVVALTLNRLVNTFEAMRRNHGYYGRHSMRCVDTPDGWCCASDCTLR